jgi:hypothetical protein
LEHNLQKLFLFAVTPANPTSWDERYRQPGFYAGTEPAEFLRDHVHELPRGAAPAEPVARWKVK